MIVIGSLLIGFFVNLGAVAAHRHDVVAERIMNTKGEMKIRFVERWKAESFRD